MKAFLEGREDDLQVEEHEAREMAYHHVRVYMKDKTRPGRIEKRDGGRFGEPVWEVELVNREDGTAEAKLVIGMETGSVHDWQVLAGSSQGR